jgi:hypothetical protein
VDTPWEWRQSWHFEGLEIVPSNAAGDEVDWGTPSRRKSPRERLQAFLQHQYRLLGDAEIAFRGGLCYTVAHGDWGA